MKRFSIVNILSALRILLAPFAVLAVVYSAWYCLLAIVFIGGLSDLLDGYLAKKLGIKTRFGAILDGVSDKILFGFTIIALFLKFKLPYYYFLILTRELLPLFLAVIGLLFWKIKISKIKYAVVWLGKIVTLFQALTILAIVVYRLFDVETYFVVLIYLTSVLSIICGLYYSSRVIKQFK